MRHRLRNPWSYLASTSRHRDSVWKRRLRIHTELPDPIAIALHRKFGRDAARLEGKTQANKRLVYTLDLIIYRLEVLTATEVIASIDPEATVDVLPIGDSCEWPGTAKHMKRHTIPDLPDVSKYGNGLE